MGDIPMVDGGLRQRIWIGAIVICCTLLVLIAVHQCVDHGRILETRNVGVTVISVNSGGRGATVYLVKLPDGHTMTLPGPRLPLYPVGSTVPVIVDRFADGTTRYRMEN